MATEPTEVLDGRVAVHVLGEDGTRDRVRCESYDAAVEAARDRQGPGTVVKIEDRDGEVVFSSAEMDLAEWEREWRHARRRLSVSVEDWKCPYDRAGCVADDPCAQCRMDQQGV